MNLARESAKRVVGKGGRVRAPASCFAEDPGPAGSERPTPIPPRGPPSLSHRTGGRQLSKGQLAVGPAPLGRSSRLDPIAGGQHYITAGRLLSFCDMTPKMTSTSLWEVSVREGRELITSEVLREMARRIGSRPEHALRHLRREGYLIPLFRGFYYVRTPEEVRLHTERHDPLELFALAARAKGIREWYFGLTTALRLNGLTHEDRREESVVSRSLYRIHGIPIGSRRFVIHKWGPELFGFGLNRRGTYRVSDPEKTVLDLAYLDFWRVRKRHSPSRTWTEYLPSVGAHRVRRYLPHYPREVRRAVEERS